MKMILFGLSEDIYYPFMYKIICPTVFGDSEEHIITVVQRSIDTGTQNMCSVTLDDEVLDINIKMIGAICDNNNENCR